MSKLKSISLTITDPKGKVKNTKLKKGVYSIGRSPECRIRFPESFGNVSREHCEITVRSKKITIKDLDSSSGTFVNQNRVSEIELNSNDHIKVANVLMVIKFELIENEDEIILEDDDAINIEDTKISNSPSLQQTNNNLNSPPSNNFPQEVMEDTTPIDLTTEIQNIQKSTNEILGQVGKRIVGQKQVLQSIWATILSKGNCLLIGVPGLAKTYMVNAFSEALGLHFSRIQFTPDLMPSDIIGSNIIEEDENGKRQFKFMQGPVFTQLLLADEINRTPPKTQAALLEAMQEKQVTVGDATRKLPAPFTVVAAQNPLDQDGTYPLPEAQQDRFMLCVVLGYPKREQEVDIALRTTQGIEPSISAVINPQRILRFQKAVSMIAVSREAAEFATDLVRATRPNEKGSPDYVNRLIEFGAGPRAVQSLLKSAKAFAAMDGRPAVTSSDISDMSLGVLRHRIRCNYRARTENMDEAKIIKQIVKDYKS